MTSTGTSDTDWRWRAYPRIRLPFTAPVAALSLLLLTAPPAVSADEGELLSTAGLGSPSAPLITAADGHRYGVTADGGPVTPGGLPAIANGTVFRIAPDDTVTVLHVFSINDPDNGWGPAAALVEGPDGQLYGTTRHGGEHCAHCGTIFRITPDGDHTRLHSFNGTDGAAPSTALTVGADDRLYGATDGAETGVATLFAITTDGRFERLQTATVESGLATTQTLAEEMLATVQTFDPDVFPAPDTVLIDDFNRANANNTLGAEWTPLPLNYGGGPTQLRIAGSAGIGTTLLSDISPFAIGNSQSSGTYGGNYWNEPFAADQEVYSHFFHLWYDTVGLLVRYDPDTGNGYAVHWDPELTLYRVINNEFQTPPLATTPNNPKIEDPDLDEQLDDYFWLGLRAAGNVISAWTSPDGENWTKVLEAVDDQITGGGHVGFHLYHIEQRMDDFHAGSFDIPPPPPPGGGNGGDGGSDGGNGGEDGDGGDDGGDGPGFIDDDPAPRPTGSPGGGRQGGIGLGATGLEALALLLLLWGRTMASRCSTRTPRRKSR